MQNNLVRPVETFLEKLQCPECQQSSLLLRHDGMLACCSCQQTFPIIDELPFLFQAKSLEPYLKIDERQRSSGRALKLSSVGGAKHWEEYHIQDFLPSASDGKETLLLGCGDAGERTYLQEFGFETTAFDIVRTPGTDFLADAHRIPCQPSTFDMVLSMQVLEHLHSPWEAVKEIGRILKPGGWFVGSVAFLKPYHNSYFHMTHKGVIQLLESAGLSVDKIAGAQSLTYTFYGKLAPLGSRSMNYLIYGTVDRLLLGLRSKLWSIRTGLAADRPTDRFQEEIPFSFKDFEKLRFAPAIVFRAQKNK
jgi:SAM-dependent methyltransferase